jgi:hypothetical protein
MKRPTKHSQTEQPCLPQPPAPAKPSKKPAKQ